MWFKHDLDAAATRSEAAVYQAATESGTGPATVGKSADDKVILIYVCIILGSVCLIMGVALAITCVVACVWGRNAFKPLDTTSSFKMTCDAVTANTMNVKTDHKEKKPRYQSTPKSKQEVHPESRNDQDSIKRKLYETCNDSALGD